MPWCDDCDQYYAPSAMRADGSCPGCGRVLASKRALRSEARLLGVDGTGTADSGGLAGGTPLSGGAFDGAPGGAFDGAPGGAFDGAPGGSGGPKQGAPKQGGPKQGGPKQDKVPWHFKAMLAALGAYLAWRLVEGVVWVVGLF